MTYNTQVFRLFFLLEKSLVFIIRGCNDLMREGANPAGPRHTDRQTDRQTDTQTLRDKRRSQPSLTCRERLGNEIRSLRSVLTI